MKIMALDQSTKRTGFSVFKDNELVQYGALEVDIKEKNPLERMRQMREKIICLINEIRPAFIVFEDVQYQKNFATFQQLSQLQGILMSLLFELDVCFQIVYPTEWKSFIGVKGKKRIDQKNSAIQIVNDKYGICVSEDEAEAILIGIWAINKIKGENNKLYV